MSEQNSFHILAHPNIHLGKHSDRELRIEFSVPLNGVNEQTGLIIFVPGFGGNIDSKVYKKMREVFADKYNMITIQCDYFGSSYMQGTNTFNLSDQTLNTIFSTEDVKKIKQDPSILYRLLETKNVVLSVKAIINEKLEEFNDMSYMQAIDIITAIEAIKI